MKSNKKIKMFKNGEWIKWDGSDVDKLIIEETMTLKEAKKHYPDYISKLNELTKEE